MSECKDKARNILEAASRAGYQLAKEGYMSTNLLEIIGQPLISEDELRKRYNDAYEKVKSEEKD